MSAKTFSRLLITFAALVVLSGGGGLWYYTLGRKPKIALSVPLADKTGAGTLLAVAPGEVLLVTGGKATLYALAGGPAKWSVPLAATAPAPAAAAPAKAAHAPAAAAKVAHAPAAAAKVAAAPAPEEPVALRKLPELSTGEKPDLLLAKRTARRFAKLNEWSARLNAKKATLKTPLQIEAFNEEAGKYHAELAEARAEAAAAAPPASKPAPRSTTGAAAALPAAVAQELPAALTDSLARSFSRFSFMDEKTDVVADGGAILLLHGAQARLLDRASGAVKKDIPLPGNFSGVLRGAGCVYAVCGRPDGTRQVTRIGTADGATQALKITGPPSEGRFHGKEPGRPAEPVTQPLRTELSAAGGLLLQCDVRLVEKKIAERVIAGGPSSALEEADSKTATGWGKDAAVYAQALDADAAREDTGGRERTDESVYQLVLNRPLDAGLPEVRVTIRGHADIFSTRTLDLITAGRTLLAFDHTSKKLWESTLASPIANPDSADAASTDATTATPARPCLEAGGRLYFFDSAFLTAFDRATGQPAWRVPLSGIRRLQLGDGGALYASTGGGELPLILKVDAPSGKILWRVEKYQDCIVSGGQVYATRETRNSEDVVNAVFDRSKAIQCRWKLYKLSASQGQPQWEWFQTRRPQQLHAEGRKVALLFDDELQVVKSLAY